ncbi:SacI homology domain-containing protein [Radiomyces spectabilis]|uniref:SacI homology domain-containing protein n=1 Tax=Radiomyces spectabilis TaxID=64574 RepID=UPI00221E5030|nr:SacI homology domain-containing protein [Radiomyces spectabilis]KAI8370328.1 SacI homology domain-containing protein [Radiomyces spectabilis]
MADQQEHNAPTDIVFNKFSNGPAVKQKSLRCNDQLEDLLIGISQWPMDVAKPFSAFWQCLKSKPGKCVPLWDYVNMISEIDVGILEGAFEKYLIVITRTQFRGYLCGHATFAIEQIACLKFDAIAAQETLDKKTRALPDALDDSESESEIPGEIAAVENSAVVSSGPLTAPASSSLPPSILKRSAPLLPPFKIPFLRKHTNPDNTIQPAAIDEIDDPLPAEPLPRNEEDALLEQRLVKQIVEMFSRQIFIFSYDCGMYDFSLNRDTIMLMRIHQDITNSFQRTEDNRPNQPLSEHLWQKADKRFWWNEHLCQPLIAEQLDEWILPVMQGYIQTENCVIDEYEFEFVLISRRSRDRAGMRYQRRGIDENGNVANFVETEQLVFFKQDGIQYVTSFVQTRGSVPIFWSQSPYSLHPIPVLERDDEENQAAFSRHFSKQERLYGKQVIVNLTELTGREAIVGSAYRRHVEQQGDPNIIYIEFDFHRETKGMRFENIDKLRTSLAGELSKISYMWKGNDTVYCRQQGVFRTNCMDCLDRTNVVQSAFGRSMLQLQLTRLGITELPNQGLKQYGQLDRIFNNAWANNGDIISRMYAGTSALKGDFTRTGKRNITGIMNDASNSLARVYFNTVKDFWTQAAIDYILGYHTFEILRQVRESVLRSAEPGTERRWAKVRADAIEISSAIVIANDEKQIAGWTLLAPAEEQKSKKFEEKVLLLTDSAIYLCSYNYRLEKVVQFKRIGLDTIVRLQIGEYILSTVAPASCNIDQNYGMILYYRTDGELVRWNTGSMRNEHLADLNIVSPSSSEVAGSDQDRNLDSDTSLMNSQDMAFLIFKAVRQNVFGELSEPASLMNCREQIESIAAKIATACGYKDALQDEEKFISRKPIVSFEEAEKRDGFMKRVGYKLKQSILWP